MPFSKMFELAIDQSQLISISGHRDYRDRNSTVKKRRSRDGESLRRRREETKWRWEKPINWPSKGCSKEIVQRVMTTVATTKPKRKSRRANVVLNFDRKTAADFSGGWSIRFEPLPNRLSANKFPCQTSYERTNVRRSRRDGSACRARLDLRYENGTVALMFGQKRAWSYS